MDVFWLVWMAVMLPAFAGWTVFCFWRPANAKVILPDRQDLICRDCRHLLLARGGSFGRRNRLGTARCMHPSAMREAEDFLVRGYLDEDNMGYASIQRKMTNEDRCGADGRYWQNKGSAS